MKKVMFYSLLLASCLASACDEAETDASGGAVRVDGGIDAGQTAGDPLYAVMYEIYDDQDSNSYLSFLSSLDDLEDLDPSKAIEFAGGRAFLATYDNAIFIGSPGEPLVTRYTVTDDGEITETGAISFANFGVTTGSLDAWNVNFIDAHKAYLLNFPEGNTLIWDPSEMEILGEIPAPDELVHEDGLVLEGSPGLVRGNRLYRSFNWWDSSGYGYSSYALLGVYDTENDELLELISRTRCPSADGLAHEDEDGNFYFGNWIWPVADTLMNGAAGSCVLRIDADGEDFSQDWSLDYGELFDGRQGAQFAYVADDQALVAVFNHEDTSFDEETDPWEYAGRPFWHIWNVDLPTNDVTEIEDIPASQGAFTPVRLDGRQFLMVPGDDWGATDLWEVTGTTAKHRLHIPGWSYQFVKIR
jgi:hypothetical protein